MQYILSLFYREEPKTEERKANFFLKAKQLRLFILCLLTAGFALWSMANAYLFFDKIVIAFAIFFIVALCNSANGKRGNTNSTLQQ
ncbi:MAG: hypothetical protein AAGB24_03865 [Bacteroidota bacterium]